MQPITLEPVAEVRLPRLMATDGYLRIGNFADAEEATRRRIAVLEEARCWAILGPQAARAAGVDPGAVSHAIEELRGQLRRRAGLTSATPRRATSAGRASRSRR